MRDLITVHRLGYPKASPPSVVAAFIYANGGFAKPGSTELWWLRPGEIVPRNYVDHMKLLHDIALMRGETGIVPVNLCVLSLGELVRELLSLAETGPVEKSPFDDDDDEE